MEKRPESSKLWENLKQSIEEEQREPLAVDVKSEASRRYSLGDRLREMYLNGFIPLMLLQVLILQLGRGQDDPLFFWGGVLLALPLAFLLRPLCVDDFGLRIPRLMFVGLSLLFILPLTQCLPASILTLIRGSNLWIPEGFDSLVARTAQDQLEHSLSGIHPLLILIGLVALALAAWQLRFHSPWIEHTGTKLWHRLAGFLLLCSPALLILWVSWPPSPELEAWRKSVEPAYRASYLGQLPENSEIQVWREALAEFELLGMPYKASEITSEEHASIQKTESLYIELLKSDPPKSRQEIQAARQLFAELSSRDEFLHRPLAVQLSKFSPLFQGLGVSDYVGLNWLEDSVRSESELVEAQSLITSALKDFPSSLEDAELGVYDRVYGAGLPPLLPSSHRVTAKGDYYGTTARLAARRPLKVGHWTLDWSPSKALLRLQEQVFLKAWLETRPIFEDGLTGEESESMKLKESWTPEMGPAASFQDRFFRQYQNEFTRKRLEIALIYIRVRLYKMREGKFPDLDEWSDVRDAGWKITQYELDGKQAQSLTNQVLTEGWNLP